MKLYVFETDKWLESDVVYPHDIAVCFHPEHNKVYLWEGPRATPAAKKQAKEAIESAIHKFPHYTLELVDTNTPNAVTTFINQYINTSFEEVEKIDRDPQYVVFFYMLLGLFGGLGLGYFMIFRILGWERVSGTTYYAVRETTFAAWSTQNHVILIIITSLFAVALVFAGLTKKIFLIVTASTGTVILTGTILYLRLRVYLFDFLSGSPEGFIHIPVGQVIVFFFLNLAALVVILVPMIISVVAIQKTTTPISWKKWVARNKKSIIELKKFSILDMESEFTEIDQDLDEENDMGSHSHSDQ